MGAVPDNRFGIASGMIGALRNFGSMSGVAATSLVFGFVNSNELQKIDALNISAEVAERQAFASSVRVVFLLGAAICSIAVITSFIRDREKAGDEHEEIAAANL
jgi:hypothetical protein